MIIFRDILCGHKANKNKHMKKNLTETVLLLLLIFVIISCKKNKGATPAPPVPPVITDTVIIPGVDPPVANTIGFFLDDWQPRIFTAPSFDEGGIPATATNTVTIDATSIITKIPLSEFGHNAVWWMGPVAGDPKFIDPVTNLHPHIIRFPGGSSSDAYFWNALEGVNPPGSPTMFTKVDGNKVNTSTKLEVRSTKPPKGSYQPQRG